MALNIENGSGGVLLDGRHVVTEFRGWKASGREDGDGIRVWVAKHAPDPYQWSNRGGALTAELQVGRATWSGPAQIENEDPLIFTMEVL